MSIEEEMIYPPLTEQEFADGCGYTYRDIPLCEDEDGTWVYTYGHRNKHRFAGAVNDYDREMAGYTAYTAYTAKDVQHLYAVSLQPADGPDGWFISWGKDAQDHPLRFPMTVIPR